VCDNEDTSCSGTCMAQVQDATRGEAVFMRQQCWSMQGLWILVWDSRPPCYPKTDATRGGSVDEAAVLDNARLCAARAIRPMQSAHAVSS
jgi:hypothetical protein